MIEKLGGRKFMFALLGVVLVFSLVLTGKAEVKQLIDFIEVVGATYIGGNVVAKFAEKK